MELLEKLAPTILVIAAGFVTWFLKDKSEKLKIQREKLIEEKRGNYEQILEPIIRLFSGLDNKAELAKSIKQVQSFDYRKTSFHLMLFGSDAVVKSYNDYFQYLYQHEENAEPKEMLKHLGKVILEIRKDLGNRNTMMKEMDMLRFMIKDIDKYSQ